MNESSNNKNIIKLPIYKCHKCSSLIRIDSSQIESIKKEEMKEEKVSSSSSNINISLQCLYINCKIRKENKLECLNCSKLSLCRNCNMPLCKLCRQELKVLECNYCDSFICSQQCYTLLLKKYFNFLSETAGLSINAHESMHFFRKLLLPPHLHSALGNIKDNDLPFHVCDNCKVQNCGCIDWISCINCRKYYCIDCEDKILTKCKLQDCQSRTCCHKKQWDISCDYCNKLGDCKLIFCTKGHCSRHIIINREISYNEIK